LRILGIWADNARLAVMFHVKHAAPQEKTDVSRETSAEGKCTR
jgi:hypothetical protein